MFSPKLPDLNLSFEQQVKDYLECKFEEFEGCSFYACDLATEFSEPDVVYMWNDDNEKFVKNYFSEMLDTLRYDCENYGGDSVYQLLSYSDVDFCNKIVVEMYYVKMCDLLNNSTFINEHWNEEITLDNVNINIIKCEIGLPFDGKILQEKGEITKELQDVENDNKEPSEDFEM